MRALTLHRPWPAAIIAAGKRVENRAWRPPAHVLGTDIALHAGGRVNREHLELLTREIERAGVDPLTRGVVAVVRVACVVEHPPSGQARWWAGPYVWILEDIRPLRTPIEIPGALGLWTLPDDVEEQVLEELTAPLIARRGSAARVLANL